jgi:DNA-binding beta-propeller fold protein YncE
VYGDSQQGLPTLFVYNGSTLAQVAAVTAPVGGPPPVYMAVNPVTARVYVTAEYYPGDLWVVDGKTNTSVTVITGLADLAQGVDVDPARNIIYVVGQFGQTSEINGATDTLISTNSIGGQFDDVSIDPVNKKVYVVNQSGNEVDVVNELTNTFTQVTVPVGYTPVNSAVDIVHGLLYVANTDENENNSPVPTVSVINVK